jgi:hypothetical protein
MTDSAAFQQPLLPSQGIQCVLVNGELERTRFTDTTYQFCGGKLERTQNQGRAYMASNIGDQPSCMRYLTTRASHLYLSTNFRN